MNKTQLIGRLTKDVVLRRTTSDKSVASFTLAVNRRSKDDGADFISCIAWNKTAETLAKYVHKGDRIGVCGRIQTRGYKDKDGKSVYVTEVVVDEVEFLESKKSENRTETAQNERNDAVDDLGGWDIDESDLPF